MTVLQVEGFDYYYDTGSADRGMASRWISTGGGMDVGRFGGRCVYFTGTYNATLSTRLDIAADHTSLGFGVAIKTSDTSSNGQFWGSDGKGRHFMALRDSAGNSQLTFNMDEGGNIIVLRGDQIGTVIAVGNGLRNVMPNQFHYLECECVIDDSTGSVKLWLDGIQIVNVSLIDTKMTTLNTVRFFCLQLNQGFSYAPTFYWDDLYITDGARLGDRRIMTKRPSADTAQKDFTPNTGTTNYTQVTETYADNDTSYVQGSTVGQKDLYAFQDADAGVDIIDAVAVVALSRKTDAATRTVRTVLKSGATLSNGPDAGMIASYSRVAQVLNTNPNGGGAWNAAAFNAIEAGVEITT